MAPDKSSRKCQDSWPGVQDSHQCICRLPAKMVTMTGVSRSWFHCQYIGYPWSSWGRNFSNPDKVFSRLHVVKMKLVHIFKTELRPQARSMGQMSWMKNGRAVPIIMGCYGIRCRRLLSTVMEQHARLFVNFLKRLRGIPLRLGNQLPLKVAPFDIALDPSQWGRETSLPELANRIEETLSQ